MSIETEVHTTNGASPNGDWNALYDEEEITLAELLERPEVIAGIAFVVGLLVALLVRRLAR